MGYAQSGGHANLFLFLTKQKLIDAVKILVINTKLQNIKKFGIETAFVVGL